MFYVIYENSDERHVSEPQGSVSQCERHIINAKKLDKEKGNHYYYFIVEAIEKIPDEK